MGWSEFTDQPFVYLDKTSLFDYNKIYDALLIAKAGGLVAAML